MNQEAKRSRIIIVGAGFAGLNVAKQLINSACEVILIDKKNHHLFQPLLYQVAAAGLSEDQIAVPLREVFRRARNIHILYAELDSVDFADKFIILSDGRRIDYDKLVLATGSITSYFGHEEWSESCLGLKTLDDAHCFREKLLALLEAADSLGGVDRKLRIVLVGGGPTGVEMAGAIAEIGLYSIGRDFKNLKRTDLEIVLIEAADNILGSFAEGLSHWARRKLEELDVKVYTGEKVIDISPGQVTTDQRTISTSLILWAAGVKSTPVARWLDLSFDKLGRVEVDGYMRVSGRDDVFVIGDAALVKAANGRPLPGQASVAQQQGKYLGKLLRRSLRRSTVIDAWARPFRYRDKGMLAVIGKTFAIGEIGPLRLRGVIAWFVWSFIHIFELIGFRNRIQVFIDWVYSYFTYSKTSRILTAEASSQFLNHNLSDQQLAPPIRPPSGPNC